MGQRNRATTNASRQPYLGLELRSRPTCGPSSRGHAAQFSATAAGRRNAQPTWSGQWGGVLRCSVRHPGCPVLSKTVPRNSRRRTPPPAARSERPRGPRQLGRGWRVHHGKSVTAGGIMKHVRGRRWSSMDTPRCHETDITPRPAQNGGDQRSSKARREST